MARSMSKPNHLLLVVAVAALLAPGEASSVGFDLHHRFSPVVRRWAEARGHPAAWWPEAREGSPEYYSALARHDRAHLARRGLADGGGLLTFADGNETIQLDGSLHYAAVAVGTPNTTFLVALDTGSDLFWVPCDCKHCAPLGDGNGTALRPYSPRQSSTSKAVTCEDALCERRNACAASNSSSCPYAVRYLSANTSSSGVLVEDVVYLTRETAGGGGDGDGKAAVQARVVLGCGQEQTGLFLDGAAPDGLLGLGMDKVSVPSILAASGHVASDSFSMCFTDDGSGSGRINFGDAGSRGQAETPFIFREIRPTYNISITAITVEKNSVAAPFTAVVDSGTSFTYIGDPAYTQLATNFNSQVREKRVNYSSSVPFEYCYQLSPNQTEVLMPEVSLATEGGAVFPVMRPFIVIGEERNGEPRAVGYCLAVLKSDIPVDIIGQNFMTGLKVVFNRARSVLGWEKFDCYKNAGTAGAPDGSPAPGPGPATAAPPFRPKVDDAAKAYPGAAPVPRPTGDAAHAGRRGALGVLLLLLHLLLSAA